MLAGKEFGIGDERLERMPLPRFHLVIGALEKIVAEYERLAHDS